MGDHIASELSGADAAGKRTVKQCEVLIVRPSPWLIVAPRTPSQSGVVLVRVVDRMLALGSAISCQTRTALLVGSCRQRPRRSRPDREGARVPEPRRSAAASGSSAPPDDEAHPPAPPPGPTPPTAALASGGTTDTENAAYRRRPPDCRGCTPRNAREPRPELRSRSPGTDTPPSPRSGAADRWCARNAPRRPGGSDRDDEPAPDTGGATLQGGCRPTVSRVAPHRMPPHWPPALFSPGSIRERSPGGIGCADT